MNCLPLYAVCALTALTAPTSQAAAAPQAVARFPGATPIGVTVSRTGRIFMSFPRAFDVGPYAVAEIQNGRPVPYPNAAVNRLSVGSQPVMLR